MNRNQQGMVHPLLLSTILLAVLLLGTGAFAGWSYFNYRDQKDNVDAKIATAVANAKKQQSSDDEKSFTEREKQPTRQLVGPDVLGKVTISYPKTWSVYVGNNGTGDQYAAYLYPGSVPPLDSQTPYAARVNVLSQSYDTVTAGYQQKIKNGDLKATPVTLQGQSGTRLDGTFQPNVQGAMVLFKLRDKTLQIATESPTFLPDFNNIILPSLKFNP